MDTPPSTPSALPAVWRQRAQFLSDFGDPTTARLWLLAAAELERALEAAGAETLSLSEAARVTGYTPDHLSRHARQHPQCRPTRCTAHPPRRPPTEEPGRPWATATPLARRDAASRPLGHDQRQLEQRMNLIRYVEQPEIDVV